MNMEFDRCEVCCDRANLDQVGGVIYVDGKNGAVAGCVCARAPLGRHGVSLVCTNLVVVFPSWEREHGVLIENDW